MDALSFQEKLWIDPIKTSVELKEIDEDLSVIMDLLEKNSSENMFIIDSFPYPLRYPASETLEIFFVGSDEDLIRNQEYLKEEQKFKEVFKRLWGMSSVFVQSDILSIDINENEIGLNRQQLIAYSSLIEKIKTSDEGVLVGLNDHYDIIEMCTLLSLRGETSTFFVYPDIQTILFVNSLACQVYIGIEKIKNDINLICTTHGLYLRK